MQSFGEMSEASSCLLGLSCHAESKHFNDLLLSLANGRNTITDCEATTNCGWPVTDTLLLWLAV